MNKFTVFISLIIVAILIDWGVSIRGQLQAIVAEDSRLERSNLEMRQQIMAKELLPRQKPVLLSVEYGVVLNKIRLLESYSATVMDLHLDGALDSRDIASHYEATEYRGVQGLKVDIIVDQFDAATDMATILDNIHLLEEHTDFRAFEISKDNNSLIVKGEIYGI